MRLNEKIFLSFSPEVESLATPLTGLKQGNLKVESCLDGHLAVMYSISPVEKRDLVPHLKFPGLKQLKCLQFQIGSD